MKRGLIILAISVTVAAAVQPCRRLVLRSGHTNPHKLSKDRVASIVAWNSEHPEWVRKWREQHIVHETEILLCPPETQYITQPDDTEFHIVVSHEPIPTLDQDSTDLILEIPTFPETNTDNLIPDQYVGTIVTSAGFSGQVGIPAGFVVNPPASTAETPEPRSIVLMAIGLVISISYVFTFRRMR